MLTAIALPVLVALWWAFRPEKLWTNEKVNEPAPFDANGGPQPIVTGRFEGKLQQTSGRATIYKKPGGQEYLRLNDLSTGNGPDVHVLLARQDDQNPAAQSIDLGVLKGSQDDQDYDLPAAIDLKKYDAVVIYGERQHAAFGVAKLEAF
jgi:hypothetical protein